MLAVYFLLLLIVFVTAWIVSNDQDQVHQIAAISTAVIALLLCFSIAIIPGKFLIIFFLFCFFKKIHAIDK
ncbi:hypothetical protein [Gloeothece verrucosa]|uniref:Xanthine/uracil/vitamin C permease n=1 Tax=Gloeothece verrucosa (strain PCC 7822) TaxID=497965 RepID=E0UH28_GLOV7|nr:hypothetical protein [Gloeothece verrucosa]ADN15627.1 xanthine/uracil/vitamin C permease [Gloeothece verrucosa PCC 7822]